MKGTKRISAMPKRASVGEKTRRKKFVTTLERGEEMLLRMPALKALSVPKGITQVEPYNFAP